jgi:hypothetical protein
MVVSDIRTTDSTKPRYFMFHSPHEVHTSSAPGPGL